MSSWLIHHELERQAHWRPDHLAVWFEGTEYTYQEYDERVNRTARALRDIGVDPGDTVAVQGNNHVDLYTVFYACSKLGATYSPISTFQSSVNVEYICDTLDPQVILYTADEEIIEDALPTTERYAGDAEFLSLDTDTQQSDLTFDQILEGTDPMKPSWADEHGRDQYHNIFWTSGTTGRPKAVVRDHSSSLHFADPLMELVPFTPDSRRPIQSNMMFVAPYLQHGIPTVMGGGTLFILRKFDPETYVDLVHEKDINVGLILSAQIRRLVTYLEEHDRSITLDYLHGSIRSTEEADMRSSLAEQVVHIYATTEAGLPAGSWVKSPYEKRPPIGKPGRTADVRVVPDDHRGDIPEEPPQPGDRGEIAVKGAGTLTRYHQNINQQEKVHDGWVLPGDVVRVDEDRNIVFVGRADDRLRSGGINVYPKEVENVLTDHSSVESAVVVGTDDPKWGDRICALIVSDRDDVEALKAELDELCRASDKLVRELRPKEYAFVTHEDQVPDGALGKVDRESVVEQFFTNN